MSCPCGSTPWTATNKFLLATAIGTTYADYRLSLDAADRRDEGYYEGNQFLPPDADKRDYDEYFAMVTIGGVMLADYMNPKARNWFLGVWTIIEIWAVGFNISVGLNL